MAAIQIATQTKKLIDREALSELRQQCRQAIEQEERKILVCAGTGCLASGSLEIYEQLAQELAAAGVDVHVELAHEDGHEHHHPTGLKKSGCHGFCEMGPLVRIEPEGWLYTKVTLEDVSEIVQRSMIERKHIERLAYRFENQVYPLQDEIPFYKKQQRRVLNHCGHIDATSIYEYIGVGGYAALEKALFDLSPEAIVDEIAEANLRGRGGGGFPAGRKWRQVLRQSNPKHYVVCNGDEGDPGAFMDRSIMEGDPHRLLEGMMIAALATQSDEAYIYVRAEYPMAVNRLQNAIRQAEELGLLGENILGSEFSFSIHINQGAGAFVCGEGSALTASIEGKRGMPRVKPPRTVDKGLFECPTVLNNVETFANVPDIINHGAAWFCQLGPENSPGTKAFALTGNINNTGLIEVPMGTTLREIIFDIGGGIRDNKKFKAVQIGGPSGGCLTEKDLDLPLDFDSLSRAGAMIGSGGLVVMDEDSCMVEVARFFMSFTQNESCGKCVPCREGTRHMLIILERIVSGEGREGDLELLLDLADTITHTALCGLGKTAAFPVVSTIKNFRSEYEAHIRDKRCARNVCTKLASITIDPELCRGCSKCTKFCPVDAIKGELRQPYSIDQELCIKCKSCVTACPFKAIKG